MKRFAIFALALVLGCSIFTGCGRQKPDGNMSTPPTEAARPTMEPTTEVTMPTIPDTMPTTEPMTEDAANGATDPTPRGMMTDPIIK